MYKSIIKGLLYPLIFYTIMSCSPQEEKPKTEEYKDPTYLKLKETLMKKDTGEKRNFFDTSSIEDTLINKK